MIRALVSKVEAGRGANARVILRPAARDLARLRFVVEKTGFRVIVRAIDDFAGVSSGRYVRTRFQGVYVDYREEWNSEGDEALLFAIYIHIAVPNENLSAVDLIGLHFQPSVDYEAPPAGEPVPSDDQKRWIRGPHVHIHVGTDLDRCHFFLGDDSRRRREVWGRESVAKQMRSHLMMALDQIHTYLV